MVRSKSGKLTCWGLVVEIPIFYKGGKKSQTVVGNGISEPPINTFAEKIHTDKFTSDTSRARLLHDMGPDNPHGWQIHIKVAFLEVSIPKTNSKSYTKTGAWETFSFGTMSSVLGSQVLWRIGPFTFLGRTWDLGPGRKRPLKMRDKQLNEITRTYFWGHSDALEIWHFSAPVDMVQISRITPAQKPWNS